MAAHRSSVRWGYPPFIRRVPGLPGETSLALRDGEQTVRHLQERLGIEQSTASQHLAALRAKDFVVARRDGTSVWYSVSDRSIWKLLDIARDIYERQLRKNRASFDALR